MFRRLLSHLLFWKPAMTFDALLAHVSQLSDADYTALISASLSARLQRTAPAPEADDRGSPGDAGPDGNGGHGPAADGVVDITDTMDEDLAAEASAPPVPTPAASGFKAITGKTGDRVRLRPNVDTSGHYAARALVKVRAQSGMVVGELDSDGNVRVRYPSTDLTLPANWLAQA